MASQPLVGVGKGRGKGARGEIQEAGGDKTVFRDRIIWGSSLFLSVPPSYELYIKGVLQQVMSLCVHLAVTGALSFLALSPLVATT